MREFWTALSVLGPAFWLGLVVAISFLEAPIKFRAPGVTIPIGLGIGRLVFRALNVAEVAVLVVLWVATAAADTSPSTLGWTLLAALTVVLTIQVAGVRPPLSRRSDRILAGEELPRSRAHYVYVAFVAVKVVLLVWLAAVTVTAHL